MVTTASETTRSIFGGQERTAATSEASSALGNIQSSLIDLVSSSLFNEISDFKVLSIVNEKLKFVVDKDKMTTAKKMLKGLEATEHLSLSEHNNSHQQQQATMDLDSKLVSKSIVACRKWTKKATSKTSSCLLFSLMVPTLDLHLKKALRECESSDIVFSFLCLDDTCQHEAKLSNFKRAIMEEQFSSRIHCKTLFSERREISSHIKNALLPLLPDIDIVIATSSASSLRLVGSFADLMFPAAASPAPLHLVPLRRVLLGSVSPDYLTNSMYVRPAQDQPTLEAQSENCADFCNLLSTLGGGGQGGGQGGGPGPGASNVYSDMKLWRELNDQQKDILNELGWDGRPGSRSWRYIYRDAAHRESGDVVQFNKVLTPDQSERLRVNGFSNEFINFFRPGPSPGQGGPGPGPGGGQGGGQGGSQGGSQGDGPGPSPRGQGENWYVLFHETGMEYFFTAVPYNDDKQFMDELRSLGTINIFEFYRARRVVRYDQNLRRGDTAANILHMIHRNSGFSFREAKRFIDAETVNGPGSMLNQMISNKYDMTPLFPVITPRTGGGGGACAADPVQSRQNLVNLTMLANSTEDGEGCIANIGCEFAAHLTNDEGGLRSAKDTIGAFCPTCYNNNDCITDTLNCVNYHMSPKICVQKCNARIELFSPNQKELMYDGFEHLAGAIDINNEIYREFLILLDNDLKNIDRGNELYEDMYVAAAATGQRNYTSIEEKTIRGQFRNGNPKYIERLNLYFNEYVYLKYLKYKYLHLKFIKIDTGIFLAIDLSEQTLSLFFLINDLGSIRSNLDNVRHSHFIASREYTELLFKNTLSSGGRQLFDTLHSDYPTTFDYMPTELYPSPGPIDRGYRESDEFNDFIDGISKYPLYHNSMETFFSESNMQSDEQTNDLFDGGKHTVFLLSNSHLMDDYINIWFKIYGPDDAKSLGFVDIEEEDAFTTEEAVRTLSSDINSGKISRINKNAIAQKLNLNALPQEHRVIYTPESIRNGDMLVFYTGRTPHAGIPDETNWRLSYEYRYGLLELVITIRADASNNIVIYYVRDVDDSTEIISRLVTQYLNEKYIGLEGGPMSDFLFYLASLEIPGL